MSDQPSARCEYCGAPTDGARICSPEHAELLVKHRARDKAYLDAFADERKRAGEKRLRESSN